MQFQNKNRKNRQSKHFYRLPKESNQQKAVDLCNSLIFKQQHWQVSQEFKAHEVQLEDRCSKKKSREDKHQKKRNL
jgi:hypothetical protein